MLLRASVERMETEDIRNAQTPLSLGGTQMPARTLWKRSSAFTPIKTSYATSTPIASSRDVPPRPRHLRAELDYSNHNNYSFELNESPILCPLPSVAVFGRKNSIESDRLSATGVAATLGKMELCGNNYDNNDADLQKCKKDTIKGDGTGESSSSVQVHEQFKKQMTKNKKRKSTSPKHKSPKVFKIGPTKKVIGTSGVAKKLNASKHKNEKTKKLGHKKDGSTSRTTLKLSRYVKSPKLRTAARAAHKHHLEEMRKEKEKAMEALKIREEEEQQRREKEEIMKLRQQTVFKAQPIRRYVPLPSVKKRSLTDPISPNVSKRRRIETSSQCSSNSNNIQ